MSTFTLVLLCACVVVATAYANKKRSFESVRLEIEAVHDKYVEALKAHDKKAAQDLYHPDVRMMANERPTLIGRDAMTPILKEICKIGDVKITQEELGPENPNAEFLYERFRVVIRDLNGAVMTEQRRLIIWKDTQDGYQPYIVMYNVDHKQ